jgi:hypothetical protein
VEALRVRLVVDTGVDDALALVAAVLHPGLDLVEAVAVGGNVSRDQALTNTRFVLGLLGAHTVRLTVGASRRADGQPYAGRAVHGPDGLAGLAPPAACTAAAAEADPSARLVCLGPLTTLLGWTPDKVVATYARAGQPNHELDPVAADRVRATWDVRDGSVPPRTDAGVPADGIVADTDLGRLVRGLLAHQAARGAGLGDADAVLRLAGETRPGEAFVALWRDRQRPPSAPAGAASAPADEHGWHSG